ncbi:NAD(P)H-binding protein [Nonomuraea spiralis]|uniref:NAD(P)H-binding protein n=1 Tax=Nonomuraea spiralis TaxID=46182 RepID=UPI0037900FD7
MRIVIAGGHGKIALRLAERLGSGAVGLVRNPAHVADVEATGAEAVLCDLERASAEEVAEILRGGDAVVFAAGAGPGSGAARKDTVDRGASVLMAEAAERSGVRRFIQISSMGAGRPPAPGTGLVRLAPEVPPGSVPRDDVAAVVLALLDNPGTAHRTLELVSGDTPIIDLVATE